MFSARITNLLRLGSLVWIALSVGALFLAYTGYGADWILANASCGADGETARACNPGEPQHVLMICGWVSLVASTVELGVLTYRGRQFSLGALKA